MRQKVPSGPNSNTEQPEKALLGKDQMVFKLNKKAMGLYNAMDFEGVFTQLHPFQEIWGRLRGKRVA